MSATELSRQPITPDRLADLMTKADAQLQALTGGMDIISRPDITSPLAVKKPFPKWATAAGIGITLSYFGTVTLATALEAPQLGITNITDPRWIALFMNKTFNWLGVEGPQVVEQVVNGMASYRLPAREVLRWTANSLIPLIGWGGAIVGIPSLLINSAQARAAARDQQMLDQIRFQERQLTEAKARGRLEIAHPSYNAILTATDDPIIPLLAVALKDYGNQTPWILFQTAATQNLSLGLIPDHVHIPDLNESVYYDALAHVDRLGGNTALLLTTKPGYKFLPDPENRTQVDLSASDILAFIENTNRRNSCGEQTHYVICGSPDTPVPSSPYVLPSQTDITETITIGEVLEGRAEFVDPDESVIRKMFMLSGGVIDDESISKAGNPIYVEFAGPPEITASYRKRLEKVLFRMKDKYPIKIVSEDENPTGGVFYYGLNDAEGIALAKKRSGKFKGIKQYVIVERFDKTDEVTDLGLIPLCVDLEVAADLIPALIY